MAPLAIDHPAEGSLLRLAAVPLLSNIMLVIIFEEHIGSQTDLKCSQMLQSQAL